MYERESNSRVVVVVDANKSKEKVEISCHCCSDLESECVLKFSVDIGMIWSSNMVIPLIREAPCLYKSKNFNIIYYIYFLKTTGVIKDQEIFPSIPKPTTRNTRDANDAVHTKGLYLPERNALLAG